MQGVQKGRSELLRSLREAVGFPSTFTGGTSRVLAGVQRQEAGDLLEFRKRGGGSPWPFREKTREGLP